MTTAPGFMSSISARIGVIPIPPAINSTFRRRRASAVKTPNGPAASTWVPGAIEPILEVKSPSAFTVIRSERPSGARESENGCGDNHRSRVRKRQMKNWPARACSRSRLRPVIVTDTTPGNSVTTSATRSRYRNAPTSGAMMRKQTSNTSVATYKARQ